jgi:RNA polymerase sigma-70 factor, ECF subfamily
MRDVPKKLQGRSDSGARDGNGACNLCHGRGILLGAAARATGFRVKDTSDSELMRQVRGGRAAALATLFERHHACLYRYCLRMTGSRPTAEDLVQDSFMRILKYRATFRDDSDFVPWMFGIARNTCLGYLRRHAADARTDTDVESVPDAVEHDPAAEQQGELLRRALAALPAERREVLVLSRYEFKTYEEIADVLGCSVGAVKVRAHRALKQLRAVFLEMTGGVAI